MTLDQIRVDDLLLTNTRDYFRVIHIRDGLVYGYLYSGTESIWVCRYASDFLTRVDLTRWADE